MKETDELKKKGEPPTQLQSSPKGQPIAAISPFGLMRRFAEEMERLFENFEDFHLPRMFEDVRAEMKDVDWAPELEVAQDNGHLVVRCNLPGMKREDIQVEMKDEVLTISGERNDEQKEEREGYYRSERSYGSFYRQVRLPAGAKTDTAEATF